MNKLPLQVIFTIPFLLQMIAVVGVTGYFSWQNGQRAVHQLVNELQDQISDCVQQELKTYLATPHLINQLNADAIQSGYLPGLKPQDPVPLEHYFWQQIQRFDGVNSIEIANVQGGLIGAARYEDQTIQVYSTQQFLKGNFIKYVTNRQGQRIASQPLATHYDARLRPWYRTPVANGHASWSDIYAVIDTKPELSISAGLPIFDAQGKLQGVLATDISLNGLQNFLRQLQENRPGSIYIIEPNGLLVATSENTDTFIKRGQQLERMAALNSRDQLIRSTAEKLINHLGQFDHIFDSDAGDLRKEAEFETGERQFEFQLQGEDQHIEAIPFQDRYGLKWIIVVVTPESAFTTEIVGNTRTTLWLCLGALGITIVLNVLTSRWLAQPILHLSQATEAIAQGNFDQQLPIYSPIAELRVVARSFNRMAQQLQDTFAQVQQALRSSEAKFTKIFHCSPDPIRILTCEERRYLDVNESFLQATGYSREEVIGSTAMELELWLNPERRQQFRELLQTQGRVCNYEVEYRVKSGEVKTWLFSGEMVELEGQSCIVVVSKDISDRKQIETQLKEQQQLLQAIVSNVPGSVFRLVSDAAGQISTVFVSEGERELTGIDPDVATANPQSMFDVVHPDDRALQQQHYASFWQVGQSSKHEFRIITHSGELKWLQDHYRCHRNADGHLVIDGVSLDISDRKQLELALEASEAKLTDILNSAIACIVRFRLDRHQNVQYEFFSQGCERVFGYTSDEFMSDSTLWRSRVFPDDLEIIIRVSNKYIFAEQPGNKEYRFYHKDGSLRWIAGFLTSRWDTATDSWIVTAVEIDISDRKQAEEKLRLYERIVSATTDGIALIDTQYRYLLTNQAYAERFCKQPDEIVGKTIAEVIGQEIFETVKKPYLDRSLAGETLHYEMWYEYPTLDRQFISTTYAPCIDSDSGIWGIVISIRNRTILKSIEDALHRSEATQRAILKALPDLLIRIRHDGTYTDFFPGDYVKLLDTNHYHLSLDHPVSIYDILPAHLAEQRMVYIQQALHTGELQIYEYEIWIEGELHHEEARIMAIQDDEVLVIVRDITNRKRAEASLKASLHEKEILLSEIHHRVKNNLQVVCSLLELQMKRIRDERVRSILEDSCNRILSIALVHESLYRSQNFAAVDFAQYVRWFSAYLISTYKRPSVHVSLDIDIDATVSLPLDQAIPCGLILNELLTNALKHGFVITQTGQIYIGLHVESTQEAHPHAEQPSPPASPTLPSALPSCSTHPYLKLTVSNDGDPLSPDFDLNHCSSMGLKLVTMLAEQLEGTIAIHRGDRTLFQITFPDSNNYFVHTSRRC
jgi:PAS domain S-box-containing protein